MNKPLPLEETLYLFQERVSIKMDSGIPQEIAEQQARAEAGQKDRDE